MSQPNGTPSASVPLAPWHQPDWKGPRVETRPKDADSAEWPEGATERVTFRREDFQDSAFPHRLPQTLYFGADGWPTITPERLKPKLDVRCQAELHRYPWVARPEKWDEHSWLTAFKSFERFVRLRAQAGFIHRIAGSLPSAAA